MTHIMNDNLFKLRILLTTVSYDLTFVGVFLIFLWPVLHIIGGLELAFSKYGKACIIAGIILLTFSPMVFSILRIPDDKIRKWLIEHGYDPDK